MFGEKNLMFEIKEITLYGIIILHLCFIVCRNLQIVFSNRNNIFLHES